jgi:polar amino acid transport system substrate-binding protein
MSALPRRQLLQWTALAPVSALAGAPPVQEMRLFAYHLKPPFMNDVARQDGLYYDFADLLSLRAPALRFRVEYLPRRRLDQELTAGRLDGLVLGVHPAWFRDRERKIHLWTPPFMRDADIVVSRHERPIAYAGPESLAGLRLALPRGYYYAGVNELVDQGRAQRFDSESEETALMMLSLERADASIITRRTLYTVLARRPGLRGRFHVAAQAHDEFERHLLVPRSFASLHGTISDAVGLVVRDPAWQTRLLER